MGNLVTQLQEKLSNNFKSYRKKVVELKQDRSATYIPTDENIDSGRLATCYGIIIYDRENRNGVGAHFSTVDSWDYFDHKHLLKSLVEEVENNLGDPSKLEAYISADGFTKNSFGYDFNLADREKLFSAIEKLGISPNETRMHFRNPDQSTRLKFNLKAGTNELIVYEGINNIVYRGDIRHSNSFCEEE